MPVRPSESFKVADFSTHLDKQVLELSKAFGVSTGEIWAELRLLNKAEDSLAPTMPNLQQEVLPPVSYKQLGQGTSMWDVTQEGEVPLPHEFMDPRAIPIPSAARRAAEAEKSQAEAEKAEAEAALAAPMGEGEEGASPPTPKRVTAKDLKGYLEYVPEGVYGATAPNAYDAIAQKYLGANANAPMMRSRLDLSYGPSRGRWYLQRYLNRPKEFNTEAGEASTGYGQRGTPEDNRYEWPGWLMESYQKSPEEFYDQDSQKDNWEYLVKLGSEGLTEGNKRVFTTAANEDYDPLSRPFRNRIILDIYDPSPLGQGRSNEYYAAMAVGNITGGKPGASDPKGSYNQMRTSGLDRLYDRFYKEQLWAEDEDRRGFAAWLSENVGGKWAATPSATDPTKGGL